MRFISKLLFVTCLVASYQNCTKVDFSATQSSTLDGGLSTHVPVSNPGAPGTSTSIRQFRPALAVRDVSCLACHANIQANLVTDFGNGNPWYMNQGQDLGDYGYTHYVPITWQSLQVIEGQVIVPNVNVPSALVQASLPAGSSAPTTPVKIADYLTMSNIIDFSPYYTFQLWGISEPSNLAFSNNVVPPKGESAVTSQNYVYIGAPTASEIKSLLSNAPSGNWIRTIDSSQVAANQFTLSAGTKGTSYFTNTGTVSCSNEDLVVNGTLLLNNLQIVAENGGCRIYVNGPVFIEGGVTYVNSGTTPDPTANLQISSSQAIIMGIGSAELNDRLITDVRSNLFLRSAPDTPSYTGLATSIINEAVNIGTTLLPDASVAQNFPTALSVDGQARAQINFTHILLNAPIVESRYLGTISGVIVAETVQSSLGSFAFEYDPLFEQVSILPALPYDILCVGASSGTCHPAQQ